MMTTGIRPARRDEAPALRRIAEKAYAPFVPIIGREPPSMLQDFAADIAAGRCWVTGEAPTGYVVAYAKDSDWLIENVAVAPEAQGVGLGRALMAFAESEGRVRGHARAVLYTNAAMTRNLTFYPALGYVEIWRRTEHGLDRVYFSKRLEGPKTRKETGK